MERCYMESPFMPLPLGMLFPSSSAAPLGMLLPLGARCSLLGMLLPPVLAAPLEEGLHLGQSASKQVGPAYHHFHFLRKVTV